MGNNNSPVRTATCTAYKAKNCSTGIAINDKQLFTHAKYLIAIVQELTTQLVTKHFNEADLMLLAAGVDASSKKLPQKAYVAMRRLGWKTSVPEGMYLPDRVCRVIEEGAGRTLRLCVYRKQILDALIVTWPKNPGKRTEVENAAMWQALPDGTPGVIVRNRTRQITQYIAKIGTMPAQLTDLEDVPRIAPLALLSAADKQLVTLTRVANNGVLTLKLPLIPSPATKKDWQKFTMSFTLPPQVAIEATLCMPTLRLYGKRIALDVPWKLAKLPIVGSCSHTRCIALDWGVNRLLTGSIVELYVDTRGRKRVATFSRPLFYDATGIVTKYHRLRKEGELLRKKMKQLEALITGSSNAQLQLTALLKTLTVEHDAVASRMRNLNSALAKSAARFAVDQAVACRATVIYIEDLASLEARGKGRKVNVRVSATVRTELFATMEAMAREVGIAVVAVPAYGTSSRCPRCMRTLFHVTAPDTAQTGYRWSKCSHCHLSLEPRKKRSKLAWNRDDKVEAAGQHRDIAASWRIGGRGLMSQNSVFQNKTGLFHVSTFKDTPVSIMQCKKISKLTKQTRSVPMRRRVPSSTSYGLDKRPEGQVPQVYSQALTANTHHHCPRGSVLGAGFHLHVYSSPIYHYSDSGKVDVQTTPVHRIV